MPQPGVSHIKDTATNNASVVRPSSTEASGRPRTEHTRKTLVNSAASPPRPSAICWAIPKLPAL